MKEIQNTDDQKLWDHHQTDNAQHLEDGHLRQDMLLRKIRRYLDSGKRMLEIGFGDGYLLGCLSKFYECSGADVSEKNVNQMRGRIKAVDFRVVSTDGGLPYPDQSFDAFIASEVLEHMSDDELHVCIGEISRVLKKGGYAFITVPAEENLKRNECFCPDCGSIFHKWGHKQYWDKEKIKKNFSTFKIITIQEYFNRFRGKGRFENIFGIVIWIIQTAVNYVWKFPSKLVTNKTFIIILKMS